MLYRIKTQRQVVTIKTLQIKTMMPIKMILPEGRTVTIITPAIMMLIEIIMAPVIRMTMIAGMIPVITMTIIMTPVIKGITQRLQRNLTKAVQIS